MKIYNRSLDYIALALNAMVEDKNHVMAARLFAKAAQQPDALSAIATLEASNKHAFELQAKAKASKTQASAARLKASEDDIAVEDAGDDVSEDDADAGEDDDPLADLSDDTDVVEEAPAEAMAKVLSRMARRSGKR